MPKSRDTLLSADAAQAVINKPYKNNYVAYPNYADHNSDAVRAKSQERVGQSNVI